MAVAEGKRRPFLGIDAIESDILETFAYQMSEVVFKEDGDSHCEIVEDVTMEHLKQEVVYSTDELSALCPYSGLPDQATLVVKYTPNRKVLELKSFKYYLMSYREVGIYQEHITQRIFKDLKAVLEPLSIEVETIYNTRGGIDTTCRIKG